jgi:hypothetical protein
MYRDHFHFVANEIELDDVVDFVCRIRGQAFAVDVTHGPWESIRMEALGNPLTRVSTC